jgi:rRNA maturation endonuclease Nob1
VPKAKRNWIQEERWKTLGDYVAFCLRCGFTQRYFLENEAEVPDACPDCGGEVRHRCPACDAPFPSAFQVECEECGAEVRSQELFGGPIRRADR